MPDKMSDLGKKIQKGFDMNLKDLSDFGGQISRKIRKIHFI